MKKLQVLFQTDSLKTALLETRNQIDLQSVSNAVQENLPALFEEAREQFGPERTFLLQVLSNFFRVRRKVKHMEDLLESLNRFVAGTTENAEHALAMLCNNFVYQFSGGDVYGEQACAVTEWVVGLLDEECVRTMAGNEDLAWPYECVGEVVDCMSRVAIDVALPLSRWTLVQLRRLFGEAVGRQFLGLELKIPSAPKAPQLPMLGEGELQGIAGRVEEKAGGLYRGLDGVFHYLADEDVGALHAEATGILEGIHRTIKMSAEKAGELAMALQALEQHVAVDPSPWKNKAVCDELYAALAFTLHYQFRHQGNERGRFTFFFGHDIPKLRVTLLKLAGQLGEKCPQAWDLARLYGTLQLVALGYLGDGATPGVKEACTLGLHWHCEGSPENVALLRAL